MPGILLYALLVARGTRRHLAGQATSINQYPIHLLFAPKAKGLWRDLHSPFSIQTLTTCGIHSSVRRGHHSSRRDIRIQLPPLDIHMQGNHMQDMERIAAEEAHIRAPDLLPETNEPAQPGLRSPPASAALT